MSFGSSYRTRQGEAIEAIISKNAKRHFSVDSLCELLQKSGKSVGRTTVYRHLERLVGMGKVRKYVQSSGESACYQYLADECREHSHLKCESCGKLIHLECSEIEKLGEHIKAEHGFKINAFKTVLYGLCEDCAKQ